jgi:nucleoredoxin
LVFTFRKYGYFFVLSHDSFFFSSAQWCHRCQAVTSKLAQTYNNALIENNNLLFDIVFVSSDNDQETFNEYYQDMPWKAIPFQGKYLTS